ncbi:MAG: hypothetical protein IKK08_07950 [Clostridia bacterium]|nr:hypothetical protein [Clostridia bacterium]
MSENKIRTQIHNAVDRYCAKCEVNDDPYLAQRVLNASHVSRTKGGIMVKKKLSVGFVMMMAAMLLSVTALAADIVMNMMTRRVAEMDAQGQFMAWGLEEKHAFVLAMRDSGFDMNESDWAILSDETKPDADREAAADRIVYERYGAVQEEANAQRPMPLDSVMGEAPDPVLIFRERFLAENPDATEYDYWDALGYWLRDEYHPQFFAAQSTEAPVVVGDITLTKEMAEESFRDHLTEVFNWPASIVNKAQLVSKQDVQSGAWHVTTTIEATVLENALGSMVNDATFEDTMITKAGNSYVVSYWVTRAENGSWERDGSLESLLANVAETNKIVSLHTIYIEEAEAIGVKAIADLYGLSDTEVKKYFVYNGDTYWNDPSCVRVAVLLRTRNNSAAPWDYAAIVNLTTAQADDVFAANDLPAKAVILAENWNQLQENDEWLHYYRWFTTWNPYGSVANMPQADRQIICEAFQEHVKKLQEALTDPKAYDPLQIFALPD